MSTENEPNEYGFAGAGTAPQPRDEPADDPVERTAVPDDDLTTAVADETHEPPRPDGDEAPRP
ncbi:hypothetical protein WEI85_30405 [Actinomycetes bacterium KLBMP 9797]